MKFFRVFALGFIVLEIVSCQNAAPTQTPLLPTSQTTATAIAPANTPPPATPPQTETTAPAPQPKQTLIPYGIDKKDFPENYNPLTGKAVQDPTRLALPALLISISNSPTSARPQAGISFADWVFEYYIGASATRFLAVFYGDYPQYSLKTSEDCPVNEEIFTPEKLWIGNRVWVDENENGLQDDWESGIGGICIHLYSNGKRIASTSTDSRGYYAFNLPNAKKEYFLEFEKPQNFRFTQKDIGNDDQDSDVDPSTGRTHTFRLTAAAANVDLGLIPLNRQRAVPTPSADYIPAEAYAGPIRSGRLSYAHISNMFPQSCLVFAGAAPDILARLSPCKIVYGVDLFTPNSALLPVSTMQELAESARREKKPDYSGNLFDGKPPEVTREAAKSLLIQYHPYNQSYWVYDILSQSYLRFTDNADGTGIFHPARDRLTDKQQHFENVIVLQAEHLVFRHNQYEINISPNRRGFAYLFRDGGMQKIYWSTENRSWEKETGLLRPIHFLDLNNQPIALRPGKTWIHLVTPQSSLHGENGAWEMNFVPPYDPPDEN